MGLDAAGKTTILYKLKLGYAYPSELWPANLVLLCLQSAAFSCCYYCLAHILILPRRSGLQQLTTPCVCAVRL